MGNPEEEANKRNEYNPECLINIVKDIQVALHQHNGYVREFKAALEGSENNPDLKVIIRAEKNPQGGQHPGRFNAPAVSEVAMVLADQASAQHRDIVLQRKGGPAKRINELDALQYPLLHAFGEDGYSIYLKQVNPANGQETNKGLSAVDFYAYRLMICKDVSDYLLSTT